MPTLNRLPNGHSDSHFGAVTSYGNSFVRTPSNDTEPFNVFRERTDNAIFKNFHISSSFLSCARKTDDSMTDVLTKISELSVLRALQTVSYGAQLTKSFQSGH
jgi:hypothetical protein